jgi:hypothetical protein
MVATSTVSGASPSKPRMTAPSLPCPRPVAPSEPNSSRIILVRWHRLAAHGAQQEFHQPLGVRPHVTVQGRLEAGRRGQRVHHGPAGQRVQQQRHGRIRRQFAAVGAAADNGAGGEHLRPPDAVVVFRHTGNGAGLQAQPQRGPAARAGVQAKHLDGEFGEVAAERAGVGVGHARHPHRDHVREQRFLAVPAQSTSGSRGRPGDTCGADTMPAFWPGLVVGQPADYC